MLNGARAVSQSWMYDTMDYEGYTHIVSLYRI